MAIVFWLAAALVAFAYAGYPLLMALWARLHARPFRSPRRGVLPGDLERCACAVFAAQEQAHGS